MFTTQHSTVIMGAMTEDGDIMDGWQLFGEDSFLLPDCVPWMESCDSTDKGHDLDAGCDQLSFLTYTTQETTLPDALDDPNSPLQSSEGEVWQEVLEYTKSELESVPSPLDEYKETVTLEATSVPAEQLGLLSTGNILDIAPVDINSDVVTPLENSEILDELFATILEHENGSFSDATIAVLESANIMFTTADLGITELPVVADEGANDFHSLVSDHCDNEFDASFDDYLGNAEVGDESSDDSDASWGPPQKRRASHRRKRRVRPYTASAAGYVSKEERKKEQNKNAATRYRVKKREEEFTNEIECEQLEKRNAYLRRKIEDLQHEIGLVRGLIIDIFKK